MGWFGKSPPKFTGEDKGKVLKQMLAGIGIGEAKSPLRESIIRSINGSSAGAEIVTALMNDIKRMACPKAPRTPMFQLGGMVLTTLTTSRHST